MMKKAVLFLCVCLLMSCGVQKRVSQDIQAETTSRDSSYMSRELDKIIRTMVDDMFSREISNDLVIERRQYSAPDSGGRQHVIQEERVTSATRIREAESTSVEAVEESHAVSDSLSTSSTQEDIVLDSGEKERKHVRVPWMLLIAAAVAVLVISRLYRFRS